MSGRDDHIGAAIAGALFGPIILIGGHVIIDTMADILNFILDTNSKEIPRSAIVALAVASVIGAIAGTALTSRTDPEQR
jgi:hypothetical protein